MGSVGMVRPGWLGRGTLQRMLVTLAGGCWISVAAAESPKFDIAEYQVQGNTSMPPEAIDQVLASLIGRGRTLDDLKRAEATLQALYRERGYQAVKVLLPEQEIEDKRIIIRIIEARVSSVRVEGNSEFSAEGIRSSVPSLREGITPNARQIDMEIRVANDSPAKQTSLKLVAGEKPGSIDATLAVVEDRPQRVFATLDSTGSQQTGYHRFGLGYMNANLFDKDHMLMLQASASVEMPSSVGSLSVVYRVPDYANGLVWDAYLAHSNSSFLAEPSIQLNTGSTADIQGLRVAHRLPAAANLDWKMSYGLESRSFRCNQSLLGQAQTCIGLPDVRYTPGSIASTLQLTQPSFQAGASFTLNWGSISAVGGGSYTKALLNLNAAMPVATDWQLRGQFNKQLSPDTLLSYEKFSVGGASSVRGYTEGQIRGDQGYWGGLELQTPDLAGLLDVDGVRLNGVAFFDQGKVSRRVPAAGEDGQTRIASQGVGLRLNVGKGFSARADWAKVIESVSPPGRTEGGVWGHFSIMQTF